MNKKEWLILRYKDPKHLVLIRKSHITEIKFDPQVREILISLSTFLSHEKFCSYHCTPDTLQNYKEIENFVSTLVFEAENP